MSTILQFQYVSGGALNTVTFSDLEMYYLDIFVHQKVILKRKLNREPILYYIGAEWNEITATIHPLTDATIEHVKTLRDCEVPMCMTAYFLNGTQSEQFYVRSNPNVKLYTIAGSMDRSRKMVLKLYESVSGDAVPFMDNDLFVG